jgi:hypothetical protein
VDEGIRGELVLRLASGRPLSKAFEALVQEFLELASLGIRNADARVRAAHADAVAGFLKAVALPKTYRGQGDEATLRQPASRFQAQEPAEYEAALVAYTPCFKRGKPVSSHEPIDDWTFEPAEAKVI